MHDGGSIWPLGPAAPPAPRQIPKDRYGAVALLCRRHTRAEVAAPLGVSQVTI